MRLYWMWPQKKEKWMWKLIALYNQWLIDWEWHDDKLVDAREYLYGKVIVLIWRMKRMVWEDDWHDMIQNLFMRCDQWMMKSVEREFHEKQVYTYLKTRVRGIIINHYRKREKEDALLSYSDYATKQEIEEMKDTIALEKISALFLEFVMEHCTAQDRSIILLDKEECTIADIAQYLQKKNTTVSKALYRVRSKFKQFLANKWITHEDIC